MLFFKTYTFRSRLRSGQGGRTAQDSTQWNYQAGIWLNEQGYLDLAGHIPNQGAHCNWLPAAVCLLSIRAVSVMWELQPADSRLPSRDPLKYTRSC